jgi:serine/threonine protein kinase
MRQLDHPNIVRLIDFSESRQYYYIVLELCPGGELFHQIVRLTYFSEDLSRHVIVQVAMALMYLHEDKGVVHRSVQSSRYMTSIFLANKRAITVTSSRKIYFSIHRRLFQRAIQNRVVLMTRTRLMKVNLSQALEAGVSDRSRLQILAFQK